MKKIFIIVAIILVCLVAGIGFTLKEGIIFGLKEGIFFNSEPDPCDKLMDVSNNPQALSMLFEKLTFYFKDPTYLSRYESIRNYSNFSIENSTRINHGLGIEW